jgi:hypothetical protein
MSWWERNIVEPEKFPLLLLLAAFIVTFLATRVITRSIRAGRGPFRDVETGKVQLHHSVPGIILLTAGAVAAVAVPDSGLWVSLAAIMIGIGASLVFDEFALLLNLTDVLVVLAVAAAAIVVCVLKGKYRLALVAVFLWPVAAAGAIRLARPGSWWDRRYYAHSPGRAARARTREDAFDERWSPMWRRLGDLVAGVPGAPGPR